LCDPGQILAISNSAHLIAGWVFRKEPKGRGRRSRVIAYALNGRMLNGSQQAAERDLKFHDTENGAAI